MEKNPNLLLSVVNKAKRKTKKKVKTGLYRAEEE